MSSKTIDEKVVEMRFDNKHFEKNVQTSLSTLDKLKQKLNLTGASKGLENIGKQAEKVSFINMENSLAALEKRFSITGIAGMTFIQNITNGLLGVSKKLTGIIKDGIIGGGYRRASNIENAKFQLNGLLKDAEKVAAVMKDVDYGVTDTAYGLDAAATVAAQLVASGMEAGEGMRHALRGISGVAAMTNSSYEEIGRIYTTVAGNGRLMGDQLLQLSSRGMNAAATLGKYLNKSEADIRKMVSKGQISFETFSKAMDDAFGEHAKDANNTLNGVISNIKSALARIGELFFAPIIAENSPLIQFLNSVRVRINEIKKNMVPIAEDVTRRINNFLTNLNEAFKNNNPLGYNPFSKFITETRKFKDVLDGVVAPLKKVTDAVNSQNGALKEYSVIVDEIIRGEWGNAPTRWEKLTEAGYNWAHAQNLVNERLGSSVRHQDDYVEKVQESIDANQEVGKSANELIEDLTKLSEAQLREMGYTEEQIEAIKLLGEVSKKTGIPIQRLLELLDKDQFNTRFLLLNSLKNIGASIASVFKSVFQALGDVFNIKPKGLFDLIAAFHKLSVTIRNRVEGNADKLTRTLRGLFAIIHLITSFLGSGLKLALKILEGILSAFNLSILDFTAIIGDVLYKFDRWITENNLLVETVKAITLFVKSLVLALKDWITHNEKIMSQGQNIKNTFKGIGEGIKNWVQGLKETDNIPKYIFEGLAIGIKKFSSIAFEVVKGVFVSLIEFVKKLLGIHSPSTVFFDIGKNIILGLIGGIKSIASAIPEIFETLGDTIVNILKNLDLGKIVAIGMGAGMLVLAGKIVKLIDKITAPLIGLGDLFTGLGSMAKDLGNAAKSFGTAMKFQGIAAIIKSLAIALAVLAASVYLLSKVEPDKLWPTVGAVATLAAIIGVLTAALAYLASSLKGVQLGDIGKLSVMLTGLSVSLFLMASVVKKIGNMDTDKLNQGLDGTAKMIAMLSVLILAIAGIGKLSGSLYSMDKVGKMLLKVSLALLIMVAVIKLSGNLKSKELSNAITVLGMFGVFCSALIAVSYFAGEHASKAGSMILKISVALLILVATIKLAGMLKAKDLVKAIGVMTLFGVFIGILIGISKYSNKNIAKIGLMALAVSGALLVLTVAMHLMGMLKPAAIAKGVVVIGLFGAFMAGLIQVAKNAGKNAAKIGQMLLMVSASILLLVGAIFLIGEMDPSKVARGLGVITILGLLFAGLIQVSKSASKNKAGLSIILGSLITLIGGVLLLANVEENKLKLATTCLSALMIVAGTLSFVLNRFGKIDNRKTNFKKVAKLIGEMTMLAIPLAAFGLVLWGMSYVNGDDMIKKAAVLSAMVAGAELLIERLNNIKVKKGNFKNVAIMIGELAMLGVPLAEFAGVLWLVSKYNSDGIIKNTTCLIAITTGAALLLNALNNIKIKSGKTSDLAKNIGLLTLMAGPLLAFAGVLAAVSDPHIDASIKNVIALTILAGTAMALLAVLSLLGALDAKSTAIGIGMLALMAVPLLTFVGVLAVMQNVNDATKNVKALVKLCNAMTLLLVPLTLIGTLIVATEGIGAIAVAAGILSLTSMVVPLLAFVGVLAVMSNVDNAAQNCKILTDFITVLGNLLTTLTVLSPMMIGADIAMSGMTAIIVAIGALAAGIGVLNEKVPGLKDFVDKGLDVLKQVAGGIGEVIGAFVAGLASGAISILPAVGKKLTEFINNASGFIEGVKKVDDKAVKGATALVTTIGLLMVESFLDGALKMMGIDFTGLGTKLSDFATNAETFFKKIPNVNPDSVKSVEIFARIIAILAAANFIDNINCVFKYFDIGDDLKSFADKFGNVGQGLKDFVDKIGDFDTSKVPLFEAAAKAIEALVGAAKKINELNGENFWGKLAEKWSTGEVQNMKTFTNNFGEVAKNMKEFSTNLTSFTKRDVEVAQNASEAIKAIASAAGSIRSFIEVSGSLDINPFDGDIGANTSYSQTLPFENFLNKLPEWAKKMQEVLINIGTFKEEDLEKVKVLSNLMWAIKDIANLGFEGKMVLGNVGNELRGFSEGVSDFIKNLSTPEVTNDAEDTLANFKTKLGFITAVKEVSDGINQEDIDKVKNMGDSLKDIFTEDFKKTIETFTNDIDTDKFKTNLVGISGAFSELLNGIKDYNDQQVSSIQAASDAINTLSSINFDGLKEDSNLIENTKSYGAALVEFASKLEEFNNKMMGIDDAELKGSINKFEALKNSAAALDTEKIENLKTFGEALVEVANTSIESFITRFNDETNVANAQKAIESLITAIVTCAEGLEKSYMTPHLTTLLDNAISSLLTATLEGGTLYTKSATIGKNFVQGFANGINNNASIARNAAKALGEKANAGLQEGIDSHSPSKIAMKIGGFFGEGFIGGIEQYYSAALDKSYSLGDQARLGLQNAISKVSTLLENGIDDDITIRPILDLSNVESGINTIGQMFRNTPVGVLANVNAISTNMSRNRQNGGDDVVSAIDRLRGDLGSKTGDTYNINGITYDDGSEVSNAIKTLVRAAKIERRV